MHCEGKLNYGYYTEKKKVFINEEEAPIVKEIFERYAAGERGKDIAISFAERSILYRGKPFSAANIYVILYGEKHTGKVSKCYKCWNASDRKIVMQSSLKKDLLKRIVLKSLQETLTGKNLSVIVDEIYKQHNAKLLGDNPVKTLEKELLQINKSINNIMEAIEQGIITDTTKERLQGLETRVRSYKKKPF